MLQRKRVEPGSWTGQYLVQAATNASVLRGLLDCRMSGPRRWTSQVGSGTPQSSTGEIQHGVAIVIFCALSRPQPSEPWVLASGTWMEGTGPAVQLPRLP